MKRAPVVVILAMFMHACSAHPKLDTEGKLDEAFFDVCYYPIFENPFGGLGLGSIREKCVKLPRMRSPTKEYTSLARILKTRKPGEFDRRSARIIISSPNGPDIYLDQTGGGMQGNEQFTLGSEAPGRLNMLFRPILDEFDKRD